MSQPASINHPQPGAADLVAAARQLGLLIRDCRGESERERRLPAAVLSAMHEARLFRMYVPIEYGGLETDPITSMQVVEAVAEADAAAAWNLMIGATYGIWAAFLPEASSREIYGATPSLPARSSCCRQRRRSNRPTGSIFSCSKPCWTAGRPNW
jgi:hypothetical protein